MGDTTLLKEQLKLVERKNLTFAHHPLSADEHETIDAIVSADPNCDILVTPNHHIDAEGVFHGFRVAYPRFTRGVALPINREMFFGHTIVEASTSTTMNSDVMRLFSDPPKCRELMRSLLEAVDLSSSGHEATLQCAPENIQTWDNTRTNGGSNVYTSESRATDSRPWLPELPVRLGIYHSFGRGFSKDMREHKVFIGVTGGCTLAAESYYNLLLDIGKESDVDEIVDSEETFWLRHASYRARCRLLATTAEKFGLPIKTIADINSYDEQRMALSTTDSVYNNITRLKSGHVAIFSEAIDTTTSKNGIVNAMHASEGLWVYKGITRSSSGTSYMGFGFGDQRTCGVFPSGSFRVMKQNPRQQSSFTTVYSKNQECVVTYKCDAKNSIQEFSWPDESYFDVLRSMNWDRNNGIVELMPIVVGLSRW